MVLAIAAPNIPYEGIRIMFAKTLIINDVKIILLKSIALSVNCNKNPTLPQAAFITYPRVKTINATRSSR